jgi:hypothetical protein
MQSSSIKISFFLFWWNKFNQTKYTLYLNLIDIGMHSEFAFKKVNKMSVNECIKYQAELNKTSKAYKLGYADGDYWNGSQNPYSPEISPRNYLDYEQGFRTCKEDKKRNGVESFVKEQLAKYK